MTFSTRKLLPAATAALALAALPAVASADSIVYIDGGNVWSAKPDGTARLQLTDGGDWHDPTQADDGTIAAVKGTDTIQFLAKDGRPLHAMTTRPTKAGDGSTLAPRPVDLALSPDGKRLAYSYVAYSCPPASSCGTIQRATSYTETNLDVASDAYGFRQGVSAPTWVTGSRVLTFGGYLHNANFEDLGVAGPAVESKWFSNEEDTSGGEFAPDRQHLAILLSYGDKLQLSLAETPNDVTSGVPSKPTVIDCSFGTDAKLASPTWSPDGTGLAFSDKDGIEVARFSRIAYRDCAIQAGGTFEFAPTGSQPDWGPADPATARYLAPTGGGTAPGTGGTTTTPGTTTVPGGTGPAGPTTPSTPLKVSVAGAARQAVRGGALKLACTAPGARTCAFTVSVKLGRTIAKATANGRPGAPVTLRFKGAPAKQLAAKLKHGTAPATVSVAAIAADGRQATATRKLTLTR